MLKCDSVQSQLSTYIDREMPLWEIELIRWHLKRCPRCAHEVAYLQQTDGILRELDSAKASDHFLSDVMRQASAVAVNEKREVPLPLRAVRRLHASLAWRAYRLQTRARPYAVAFVLTIAMAAASLVTLYPLREQPASEEIAVLTEAQTDPQTVLVSFEIVPIDAHPKPHLYRQRP
jgi:anti-sigma factor RsiW